MYLYEKIVLNLERKKFYIGQLLIFQAFDIARVDHYHTLFFSKSKNKTFAFYTV